MALIHFGSRQRRLFGIYEPARDSSSKVRAILLCHPMGIEQVYAYRTMRQLAARLARSGFHVLRFDYFATGDSYGDDGEGDLTSWCGDVETAIEELKDMTGAAKVSLVGLRLGANLATRAAAKRTKDVNQLVLWEPLTAEELAVAETAQAAPSAGSDLVGELSRGNIQGRAASLPSNTLVVLTAKPPNEEEFGPLAVEYIEEPASWIEERMNAGSIPVGVLDHVVNWLK